MKGGPKVRLNYTSLNPLNHSAVLGAVSPARLFYLVSLDRIEYDPVFWLCTYSSSQTADLPCLFLLFTGLHVALLHPRAELGVETRRSLDWSRLIHDSWKCSQTGRVRSCDLSGETCWRVWSISAVVHSAGVSSGTMQKDLVSISRPDSSSQDHMGSEHPVERPVRHEPVTGETPVCLLNLLLMFLGWFLESDSDSMWTE